MGNAAREHARSLFSTTRMIGETLDLFEGVSSKAPGCAWPSMGKRALDLTVAGAGLIMSAPVSALLAALIKIQDGGPVFYSQERVGLGGRRFAALKFRSMIPDAEAVIGAVQSGEHDPRVTTVGRFMRATAMDELPQLWNIFRGDMSFVGPRALRPGEIEVDGNGVTVPMESIPGYAERHSVRPGLTGIAQIFAARDIPRRHKFRYDRLYLDRQSLWLDARLIALSFLISFRGKWEAKVDEKVGRTRDERRGTKDEGRRPKDERGQGTRRT
jgi:lipopolysaccharide/colanic/teichoic acid biosynthesis glycosyltransferase